MDRIKYNGKLAPFVQINERVRDRRKVIGQLKQTPANRRLRYIAYGLGAAMIILMSILAIWMYQLSFYVVKFVEGSIGLCAIAFVIVSAIIKFRLNKGYQEHELKDTNE